MGGTVSGTPALLPMYAERADLFENIRAGAQSVARSHSRADRAAVVSRERGVASRTAFARRAGGP
ncbi:hypothetical protein, partial [Streptomyces sp. NPDC006333]|uniref:hypothetical protein n=1 Tax=Streptomyces sp. NPDC006333 TaxID=3156753 RepID=UPI0033AEE2E2